MGRDGVFPAEMPDQSSRAIVPLDPGTAERLLSGRLDPDDAPPGYAPVARLLRAAASPTDPAELTGQDTAMAAFRLAHRGTGHPGRPDRGAGRGRARGARGRLVALALAGVVAVGGVGLWTAGGAPLPGELGSPSWGPSAGGRGSGAPGSGAAGPGAAGVLRPVRDGVGTVPGKAPVRDGRPPAGPAAREPAAARPGGDLTSRGGPGHRSEPKDQGKQGQAKPKPPKPKGPKPKALKG